MKKVTLIGIILIFLATGCCGLYNLNNFILPDDLEFIALIKELDTPQKICFYLINIFEVELHSFKTLTPYEFWKNGMCGDCDDCSTFVTFCANYHGYTTYQIIIQFKTFKHAIGIFEENGGYTFTDTGSYYSNPYQDFISIVNQNNQNLIDSSVLNEQWINYKVYDYDMNIVEQGYNN